MRAQLNIACLFGVMLVAFGIIVPSASAKQPRFGVEIEGGFQREFSSYLRNEVYLEQPSANAETSGSNQFQPFLADRVGQPGPLLTVRMITRGLTGSLSFGWFDLERRYIHHRGQSTVPETRIRPDGSVDDADIEYEPLDAARTEPIGAQSRARLFWMGLGGGYRFLWPYRQIDLFVPVTGQLVLTQVSESGAPTRFGVKAGTGVGVSLGLGPDLAVVFSGRLHALVTPHYLRRQDAARRSSELDESTEAAFFASQLSGNLNGALQFRFR